MKIKTTQRVSLDVAAADGLTSYRHDAGATVDVPDDIAALLIAEGRAERIERAVRPKGQRATRK